MRAPILITMLFAFAGLAVAAFNGPVMAADSAPADDGAYGLWLVESKRAAVEIAPCGASLCGTVAWIIEGGLTRDEHNPDKKMRDRPVCGMKLLRGFERDAPGQWSGGKIYDAKEGKTYKATIKVKDKDTLDLRGYIGIPLLGKTQEWTRLDEAHERCAPPEGQPATGGK